MDDGRKPLDLEDMQRVELETLAAFHKFCEEHGLRYYLCGGTLLGAVRHKGFIPWDDDVDVMMPRPDMVKLLELAPNGMIDPLHRICSHYYEPDVPTLPGIMHIYDIRTRLVFDNRRVPIEQGCFIDIFPLDGVPASREKRKRVFRKARILMLLVSCNVTKIRGKRRAKMMSKLQYLILPVLPLIRLPGYKFYRRLADHHAERGSYSDSEYVAVLYGSGGEHGETMRKNDLEKAVLVEFERHRFYAMANYDEYLTNMYGDYMKLPPKDKQVSHHHFQAFWIESQDAC